MQNMNMNMLWWCLYSSFYCSSHPAGNSNWLLPRYWFMVSGYWFLTTGSLFLFTSSWWLATGSWLLVPGYCFMVPGSDYWFIVPVIGSWFLVTGYWLPAQRVVQPYRSEAIRAQSCPGPPAPCSPRPPGNTPPCRWRSRSPRQRWWSGGLRTQRLGTTMRHSNRINIHGDNM